MKYFLVLLLAAVASANYDPFYFAGHEEVVYKYYADVRTDVYDPEDFASQFLLRGDLHIRNDKTGNGSVFWLTNVEVSAYNGKDFYSWETVPTWTPLTKQAEAYMTPFYVGYYETGLVDDIIFHHDAPQWVHNVHKGIASVFQLDFNRIHTKKPYAFETHESTLYGNCTVDYAVVPTEKEFVVTKYQDPRHCEGFMHQSYENYFPVHARSYNHDDHYRTRSERIYHVAHDGTVFHVTTSNTIARKISNNNYNTQYVNVNQKFDFVKFVPTTETTIDLAQFTAYFPVTFTEPHVDADSYIPDISFGFYQFDAEYNVKRVRDFFYEAVEYLKSTPINSEIPDNHSVKQGQAINRIVSLLRFLNTEQFQTVYEYFTGKTERDVLSRTLFYRVLPNVGTRPAAMFIKTLITSGKVTGYEAAQLLYTLGTNFVVPTEKVLTELEEFIHWETQTPEVRTAAVLTYATLVYKTFHKTDNPNVEKYIKSYYMGLQKAKTYEERLMWLEGLGNIRMGSVYKLLYPIVLGEQVFDTPYDHHFRVHAIWQMIYAVRETKTDAFETFWSVLADRTLSAELRIAAMKGVLLTGTYSELKYVWEYVKHEKNMHILNYFYSFVKSVSHVHTDFHPNITDFADQFESFYQHETYDVNTRSFLNEYFDEEHGLGYFVSGNTMANETTNRINQFYYTVGTQYSDIFYNDFAVYARFEGIEIPFFTNAYGFDFSKFTKTLYTGEPIHVELIFVYHDQVFFVRHFDKTTIYKLMSEVTAFAKAMEFTYTGIFYSAQEAFHLPTDFGLTAQFYTTTPFVYQFYFNPIKMESDGNTFTFKFESFFRMWSHSTVGVQMYNPMSSMYQGARRVFAYDINAPLNMEVTFDIAHMTFKAIHVLDHEDEHTSTFGVKTHATSQVYILPDRTYNILDTTCKACDHYTTATNVKFRGHEDIFEHHSRFFGRVFYFGVYDYEYSPSDFFDHDFPRDLIDFDFAHNFGHMTFKRFLLGFQNWFMSHAFIGHKGNFGFLFYSKPCKKYPTDKWELDFHLNRTTGPSVGIPEYFYSGNTTVTTSYHDHYVTKYGFTADFENIYGRSFHDFKFHLWRQIAESHLIHHMYFTRDMKYNEHTVSGVYNYYFGSNYDKFPVYDQFHLTTEYHAERSMEQQSDYLYHEDHHTYSDCQPQFPWVHSYNTTVECVFAHTTLRHVRYYFNYVNFDKLPTSYQHFSKWFWHFILVNYKPTYHATPVTLTGKRSFSVEVVYPIAFYEPEVYATVTFPGESYVFNKFPVSKMYYFNQLEYLYIPDYVRHARFFGGDEICEIYNHEPEFTHFLPNIKAVTHYPTEKWELYAANEKTNYTWAVYAQSLGDQVAARFVVGHQWFVVKPIVEHDVEHYSTTKDRFQFTTSNDGLEYVTGFNSGLYGMRIFYVRDTLVMIVPEQGVVFTYNGYVIRIGHIHDEHNFVGICNEH